MKLSECITVAPRYSRAINLERDLHSDVAVQGYVLTSTGLDIRTWANAGPGAVRGLNRILGRPLKKTMRQLEANQLMLELLATADAGAWPNDQEYTPLEMRDIEHVLCDFDKYERVRNGEGRIRRYHGADRPQSEKPKKAQAD